MTTKNMDTIIIRPKPRPKPPISRKTTSETKAKNKNRNETKNKTQTDSIASMVQPEGFSRSADIGTNGASMQLDGQECRHQPRSQPGIPAIGASQKKKSRN